MFKSFKSHASTMAERYEGTPQAVNPNAPALSDIGGWLLIFIFGTAFSTLRNLSDAIQTAGFARAFLLLLVCLSGTAVVLLLRRDKRGVTVAKWYLGSMFLLNALSAWGSFIPPANPEIGAKCITYLFTSMVWFTYLFVSKRIKAVYYPASL
jgi:hypothetical protein